MAATAIERKLLLGGDWIETGEWVDVRSPYSGDVVGRVAKASAEHERPQILDRVAAALAQRSDEAARLISDEAGKPLKAATVEAGRAVSTYTMAAVEARRIAGEMVPMDASAAGVGKLAFTIRHPLGI